ncbi:MAG: hypothetical protein MSH60_06270, partial [Ruminococcus sp.]|nr:hypothetical protein [Ruminococcus sp.]
AQAIQMKKLSQAGVLTEERIEAILSEEKPNQKPKIKVPMERIQKYFSPDASVQEIEDTIPHATQPEGITGGYLFSFKLMRYSMI